MSYNDFVTDVFCHTCKKITHWDPKRGGKTLQCSGCGDRFPCRHKKCGHIDCVDARTVPVRQ